jgi:hypothetical protein
VRRNHELPAFGRQTAGVPSAAFGPDGRQLGGAVGKHILISDFDAYDEEIERWLREAGVAVPASAEGEAHPSSQ